MTDNENIMEFEEMDNTIVMEDEDGNEVAFQFLDMIEYDDHQYAVLLPADEDPDEEVGEVAILEMFEEGEEIAFETIEDEDTLNAVFEIFKEKFADEIGFVD